MKTVNLFLARANALKKTRMWDQIAQAGKRAGGILGHAVWKWANTKKNGYQHSAHFYELLGQEE